MSTKQVDLRAFPGVLKRDLAKMQRTVNKAVKEAAKLSSRGIYARTPKAFGNLRDSIHTTNGSGETIATIAVSAPHAAAVEKGSRPHLVPLEDLIKWVKLRGAQGLTRWANQKQKQKTVAGRARLMTTDRKHGPTTRAMSRQVAAQFRSLEQNGSVDLDAPRQIAKRIQDAILKNGTQPHYFVRGSLPLVRADLNTMIKRALGK